MIQLQQMMNNAARAGARLASQGTILTSGSIVQVSVNSGSPNVTTTISQYLQASGITNLSGLQVSFQYLNGDTTQTQPYAGTKNQQVLVQVTLPYANLKWTNLGLINPTTLSGQCVWQCMADALVTVTTTLPGWYRLETPEGGGMSVGEALRPWEPSIESCTYNGPGNSQGSQSLTLGYIPPPLRGYGVERGGLIP